MTGKSFPDQTGYIVSLPTPPHRIISLVPSQTELLADLSLEDRVVGLTKFCVHPSDWRKQKTIIGGTKNFNFELIDKIKPDLILGNKEENYRSGIETLRKKYPVWLSDITTLKDALSMIQSVGSMTGTSVKAMQFGGDITQKFKSVKRSSSQSALYLIWREPWMAAANNTFINSMLLSIGLKNALDFKDRYPTLETAEITRLKPAYIFLSSEPYPFKASHIHELQKISPESRIMLVDGEMFSWYGTRLIKAPDYFNTLALD